MRDQNRYYVDQTVVDLRRRIELLKRGWEELSEEVEQLKRERDEAVDILRMTMNASERMVALLARIEGGQPDRLAEKTPYRGGWFAADYEGERVRRWRSAKSGTVYLSDAEVAIAKAFESYTNVRWEDEPAKTDALDITDCDHKGKPQQSRTGDPPLYTPHTCTGDVVDGTCEACEREWATDRIGVLSERLSDCNRRVEQLKRERDEAMGLLSRAVEAIESTIDLDDGSFTRSERQWIIGQALVAVADIRAALGVTDCDHKGGQDGTE